MEKQKVEAFAAFAAQTEETAKKIAEAFTKSLEDSGYKGTVYTARFKYEVPTLEDVRDSLGLTDVLFFAEYEITSRGNTVQMRAAYADRPIEPVKRLLEGSQDQLLVDPALRGSPQLFLLGTCLLAVEQDTATPIVWKD